MGGPPFVCVLWKMDFLRVLTEKKKLENTLTYSKIAAGEERTLRIALLTGQTTGFCLKIGSSQLRTIQPITQESILNFIMIVFCRTDMTCQTPYYLLSYNSSV